MKTVENLITPNLPVTHKVAETQDEYFTIPVNYKDGVIAYAFELTDAEIKNIVKNKKVYLLDVTFGNPMQPMNISSDPEEFELLVESAREDVLKNLKG